MANQADPPRIVTPQEARVDAVVFGVKEGDYEETIAAYAHTVATEPERIRAAVVKALRDAYDELESECGEDAAEVVGKRLAAIEDGADL